MGFALPWRVVLRSGALGELPRLVELLGCRSTLVVTDALVKQLYGGSVEEGLRAAGIDASFTIVETNDRPTIEKMRVELSERGFCSVTGLGGGRPVDVGKYLAYRLGRPFISAPTSISHDGFASPIVALKDEDGNPLSLFTAPPAAVVIDLDVVAKAPRRLLASGVGDIIAKVTSVADARLGVAERGEEVPESSLRLAESAARMVLDNIEEIAGWTPKGVRLLAEAGLLAGMAMSVAGSSRPCSGSEHLFSHAVDKLYPDRRSLHGEQVGVGAVIAAYLHGLDWEELREALRRVGAPSSVEELGLSVEEAAEALLLAPKLRDRYTILHKLGLTRGAAVEAVVRAASREKQSRSDRQGAHGHEDR